MSQKKVYKFSPDGLKEGWFMEDDAPAGWMNSKPLPDIDVEEGIDENFGGDVQPGEGDGTLKGFDPEDEPKPKPKEKPKAKKKK